MILFKWKPWRETEPAWVGRYGDVAPLRTFRWTIQVGWSWLAVVEQRQREGGEFTDAWRQAGVWFSRIFMLGTSHVYYDGPNCALNLGFAQVAWNLGWCNKCWPDEDVCDAGAEREGRKATT